VSEVPLIWTSKGNIPIDSLKLSVSWEITGAYIKFVERYIDESGLVVRESAHVYSKVGIAGMGETGGIGG
jgi:hypothetical protein